MRIVSILYGSSEAYRIDDGMVMFVLLYHDHLDGTTC